MIKIIVATDGEKVIDSSSMKDITLSEASVVVYRLEQVIQNLLNLKFTDSVEYKK